MEQAIRRAVEVAAASGCIRMGWTVAAAPAAGGRTGRDSRHKTAVDDAFLCRRLDTFVSTSRRTSRARKREDKSEARTGIAAAAGGKIVAAGDSPGRPDRVGNKTSLDVGTTITRVRHFQVGRCKSQKRKKTQRDRGKLRVGGAGVWRRAIRRQNRSEDRDGRQAPDMTLPRTGR